jgi:outer membrane receptor protein involved in Fe transport
MSRTSTIERHSGAGEIDHEAQRAHMTPHNVTQGLAVALALLTGGLASAQTEAPRNPAPDAAPSTTEASLRLEEVIVTAQKREESLQETPIAITAFTAHELEVSA